MTTRKEDRRVRRTREMLHEAFLDLMIEKGYDDITVQDVIDRANVGRSTFYSHFADKEQLLIEANARTREFLRQQGLSRGTPEASGEPRFGFSLAMLEHAQSHKRIYRASVGKKGGTFVLQQMQRTITDLAHDEVAGLFPDLAALPVPTDVVVAFVANTFSTILVWWLDQNTPGSALDVDQIFHRLVFSGLGSLR